MLDDADEFALKSHRLENDMFGLNQGRIKVGITETLVQSDRG
jgi:hypothetical protein